MQNNRRFVAHIDILGMRKMVERDAEKAWNALSDLATVRDDLSAICLTEINTGKQYMLSEHVFSVMFSDTIVLFTKTESDFDLRAILIATTEILHKAMCSLVPVRIGLASGQFFFNLDNSLYSGPALIEAYEIGEAAQWIGIVTTQSVHQQALNSDLNLGADYVVPASIPTKKGNLPGYAVNWVKIFRHTFKFKPPIATEFFYSNFEVAFGPFCQLDERERKKYENTTKFINQMLLAT